MAGAGYRLFNTGDVLTAAQVNTFLQEQVVMVFADSAARTTALSGVLSEGMVSYLRSTDALEVYNGSAWVGIAADQTPLTTKGDLFTFSTTDARLAVGSNGETLVADSSTTTGLRYNPPVGSLANPVINGGFDVWQRGTSFTLTTTAAYTADRWQGRTSNTAATVYSRQTTGDTTNLPNIQYCLRVQRPNGATSTAALIVDNLFETVNSIPYAGKTITLSFYARAGANYSATSGNLSAQLRTGTGTDQNLYTTGYTGAVTAISQNAALTTTWQRFAYTATLNSNITEMAVTFEFTPTGTAGANDYYEVTGVQIDVGTWTASTAPTFRRSGGTLAGELAACQRYYYRETANTAFSYFGGNQGFGRSTTQVALPFVLPVPMRIYPTALERGGQLSITDSNDRFKGGTWTLDTSGTVISPLITYVHGTAVFTAYRGYGLQADNDINTFVAFSAEL